MYSILARKSVKRLSDYSLKDLAQDTWQLAKSRFTGNVEPVMNIIEKAANYEQENAEERLRNDYYDSLITKKEPGVFKKAYDRTKEAIWSKVWDVKIWYRNRQN